MAEAKKRTQEWDFSSCAIIAAHPDDEILWAGGTILLHAETRWTILSLCRKSDPDRAPKFRKVMEKLGATGVIGDLDDDPDQRPLGEREIKKTIMSLLPSDRFDLIITHSQWGEYTKHRRHEETAKAVLSLRKTEELRCRQLWMFAYEDGGGKYAPRPVRDADIHFWLPEDIWQEKYRIITETYGFAADSFEALAAGRHEAFWSFGA